MIWDCLEKKCPCRCPFARLSLEQGNCPQGSRKYAVTIKMLYIADAALQNNNSTQREFFMFLNIPKIIKISPRLT